MAKIFWTHEERELVLKQAIELKHLGFGLLDSIRRAQKLVLPAGRWRSLLAPSSAVDMTKELRTRLRQNLTKVVTPSTPKIVASEPHLVNQKVCVDPLDDAINAIATHLAAEIVKAMRSNLGEVKELEHFFGVKKHDPHYDSDRVFKPRITIIGLLGDQVHTIGREFGEEFSIRCIDTDRAMGMNPPDSDAYLLMKNFINHPLYHKYQKFPNHVLIDGGMSSLRMWFHTKGKEL
jgi:hypothetical protein